MSVDLLFCIFVVGLLVQLVPLHVHIFLLFAVAFCSPAVFHWS